MKLQLVRPHREFRDSFLAGLAEMTTEADRASWIYLSSGIPREELGGSFAEYASLLLACEAAPPPGLVPDTIWWARSGDEIIGRISLRHELNDFLKKAGGHIGYIVRPSWRGKGAATEMLHQLLATEKARSIGRLLLTCDEDNVGSERTILKNGGRFEKLLTLEPGKPAKKHFWIKLAP